MRYEYVVTLRRDSYKTIDLISMVSCLFSVFTFVFQQLRTQQFHVFLSFFAALVLGGTVMNLLQHKKNKERPELLRQPVRYKYWLLIAGLGWLGMPGMPGLAILFFLLTFLEYQAKYPLEIGFTHDRVVINTLFKRRYDWGYFNNIVLKDGLLTLDFKNDRLFQKEVMDEEEGDADEDEFNDYCRQQLARADRLPKVSHPG